MIVKVKLRSYIKVEDDGFEHALEIPARMAPAVGDGVVLYEDGELRVCPVEALIPETPPAIVYHPVLLSHVVPYFGVDEEGMLKLPFQSSALVPGPHRSAGYRLIAAGGNPTQPCPVKIPPQLRDVVLANTTDLEIRVNAGVGPGPLESEEYLQRYIRRFDADPAQWQESDETRFYIMAARTAARFISTDDGNAVFIVLPYGG